MGKIDINSASVNSYVDILQSVIRRMAGNSSNCKTWCIGIVSAIIVVTVDGSNLQHLWISYIPITLLGVLDAFYLGLERKFRYRYDEFVQKLHSGKASDNDIFVVKPTLGSVCTLCSTFESIFSLSVLPFYGFLIVMVYIIQKSI